LRDLPNLDFVRSLAVISVVVEHTFICLGFLRLGPFPMEYLGVMGVMIFFVHTALVLMWSLERKPHTLDFYIRRWFRIYPLALVIIGFAALFHAPVAGNVNIPFRYGITRRMDIVVQATLIPNMFKNPGPPIVSVMWSLPYEVEMYILLPLLFFFVRKNFALWPLLLLWAMTVLLTAGGNQNAHNFGMAIGYFLPGVMAYVGFGKLKPILSAWILPVFLSLLWVIFLSHPNYHRAWIICLLLGLGLPLFKQVTTGWLVVATRIIARYSYGSYLTHPFALVVGLYLLRNHSIALRLFVEGVLLVALPVLAYHLVEHPMVVFGSRMAARAERSYEQSELESFRQV
jgi:peptidoglycan/LPS O-acetylase OafA/YrhL